MEVDKIKKLLNTMNALTNYIVITNYDIILPIQITCLLSPSCDTPGDSTPFVSNAYSYSVQGCCESVYKMVASSAPWQERHRSQYIQRAGR